MLLETADPWGNNEQNESLFVHGFNTQQLGSTMDGVPLGDQQYGNYNGLSVSRAVTSENVQRVELSSGAIRNHKPEIMYKAFEIAGYGPEVVDNRFGGMISGIVMIGQGSMGLRTIGSIDEDGF